MGLRINDDDYITLSQLPYTSGPAGPFQTGLLCDDNNYWHKPNDPFPMFGVGGDANGCTWSMDFSLTSLCPEDVESSDFGLLYQFSERYVTNLSGQPPSVGDCANNVSILPSIMAQSSANAGTASTINHPAYFPINPYAGGDCGTIQFAWACYPWHTIATHPDASPGSINPMRQTGSIVVTPDNFIDNSLDYPPLILSLIHI